MGMGMVQSMGAEDQIETVVMASTPVHAFSVAEITTSSEIVMPGLTSMARLSQPQWRRKLNRNSSNSNQPPTTLAMSMNPSTTSAIEGLCSAHRTLVAYHGAWWKYFLESSIISSSWPSASFMSFVCSLMLWIGR